MNLIIVEDENLTRGNLQMLLSGEAFINMLEPFADAEESIEKAAWNDADIALVDLDLPGMSGLELIAWVRENHPAVTCMVYTVSENKEAVFSAIKAGACGYLLKSSSPRELIESLHEICEGGAPMSPRIARRVITELHTGGSEKSALTLRETEILMSLDKGLSYKEIGAYLKISPHTVHTHIKKIYEKVEACNRQDALRKARRSGWI